jgi:hypothetical protein
MGAAWACALLLVGVPNPGADEKRGDRGVELLPARPALQDVSIAVPASDLKVVRSQGRFWRHVEGYLAMVVGEASVEAELALSRTLEPGRYFFFLKGRNPGAAVSVHLSCGGGAAASKDGNANRPWSEALPLEVRTPAEAVTLTFAPGGKNTGSVPFVLHALYVTSRSDVFVNESDHVVARPPARPPDLSPPRKGNLVPNGSFDVGLGQGWEVEGGARDYSIRALWEEAGQVRIPPGAALTSRVFRVRPHRRHTLSVRARSDAPSAALTLLLQNAHGEKAAKKTFPVGTAWQGLRLEATPEGDPESDCQIGLTAGGHAVWVDDVQLEEGDASAFRAKDPLEVGLVCDAPAHLFFEDEKAAMRLRVRNGTDAAASVRVQYGVYDDLNRNVTAGAVPLNVPAASTASAELDLSPGRRGIFRVVLWAGASEEEVTFAVVPRPRAAGPDPASRIGIHASASEFQYEVLKKLGVKWTRILSPEAWFRWNRVEPERGKILWHDDLARKTAAHGFEILGTIGGTEWPAWAHRDGKPDLDAWEEFVFRTADHYKPWVKHWEIWNEPVYAFTPPQYAEVLRRAARAIRRADRGAKVVGLGGSYKLEWCLDVLRELGGKPSDHFDFFSTHIYPDRADPLNPLKDTAARGFAEKVIRPYGLEVWNTEAGAWCLGFHQGPNSGFRSPGLALWPHAEGWRYYRGGDYEASRVARNFLHSIGNGFSRYFYYDSRFHAYHSAGRSHCTIFGVGDTVRAKGVAYAVLAHFFDHSLGLGNVSPAKDAFAYLFDRGGVPLAAVFMADLTDMKRRKSLALGLDARKWKAFDLMGNEIHVAGSAVTFGRRPVYLEGREGLSVEDLRAALAAARISDVADGTPPHLSIADGPRGETRAPSVRLRWIALDETSVPWDAASRDSVLYSFRLEGKEAAWGPWTPQTFVDYAGLAPGPYRFEVRARDASGNVSEVAARSFTVRE